MSAKPKRRVGVEHDGLEFHVGSLVHDNFNRACADAVMAALRGAENVSIDVVTWEREAAVAWGGDDAGETYDEDPEASVFERIQIKVNSLGRVS